MTTEPPEPAGLKGFALFNIVLGSMYLLTGVMLFVTGASLMVAIFFTLSGLLMTVGCAGLLGRKLWAQRWATLGLGAMVGLNAFISLVLLFINALSDGPPGELFWVMAGFFALTALQAHSMWRFRSAEVSDYLWEQVEAEIETSPHEVAFDFDSPEVPAEVEAETEQPAEIGW